MNEQLYNLGMNLIKGNQGEIAYLCFKEISDKYKLYKIEPFKPEDYFIPHVARFQHVKLYTDRWVLFNQDKISWQELSQRSLEPLPFILGRVSSDFQQAIVEEMDATMTIPEPCLFLGGDENYCHWINRYLMRLSHIEEYPELKKLPLVINSELSKFQRESLALLDIPEERLLKVPPKTMITFEDLIIPVNVRSTEMFPSACSWFRKKVEKYLLPPQGRRIYVSRGGAPGRIMTNEKEVLEILDKYQFEVVNPGDFSFVDQIKMFSEAEIIVGPHGAGLANLIFAPKNAFVIELADSVVERMHDFQEIAQTIPLRYKRLVSQKVTFYEGKQMHDFHDYIVDIEEFKHSLEQILH